MSNLCEQSIRNYAPPNVPILPPELSGSKTQVDLHRSPQANLLPPTTRLILSDSLDSTIESLYQTRIDNLVAAKALTFSPSSEESELVRHVEAANLYYKPPMLRNMSASKTTVQGTFVSPLLYVLKAIIQATSETEISFGDNTKQRDPGNFVVDYLFRRGLDGTPTVAVTIESYSLGESTGAAMHAALKDSTTEGVLLRNLQDREETSEVYNMLVKLLESARDAGVSSAFFFNGFTWHAMYFLQRSSSSTPVVFISPPHSITKTDPSLVSSLAFHHLATQEEIASLELSLGKLLEGLTIDSIAKRARGGHEKFDEGSGEEEKSDGHLAKRHKPNDDGMSGVNDGLQEKWDGSREGMDNAGSGGRVVKDTAELLKLNKIDVYFSFPNISSAGHHTLTRLIAPPLRNSTPSTTELSRFSFPSEHPPSTTASPQDPLPTLSLTKPPQMGGIGTVYGATLNDRSHVVLKRANRPVTDSTVVSEASVYDFLSIKASDIPLPQFYGLWEGGFNEDGKVLILEDVGQPLDGDVKEEPVQSRERLFSSLLKLHQAGITHEDFVQRNIVKNSDGDLRIIDLSHAELHVCEGEEGGCGELREARKMLGL